MKLRHLWFFMRIIWRVRRPSKIADMPAEAVPGILRNGYAAVTFFGHILTSSKKDAWSLNKQFDALKNHEMIHLRQAQSTADSWVVFYTMYFRFWLHARRARHKYPNAGYHLNPFEMEAYCHMHNLHYLDQNKNGATEWRYFARMTLDERIAFLRNGRSVIEIQNKPK